MSDEKPDDQHLFERVALLLQQQKEMYGGFEIPRPKERDKGTEAQSEGNVGAYRDSIVTDSKTAGANHDSTIPDSETVRAYRDTPLLYDFDEIAKPVTDGNPAEIQPSESDRIAACNTLEELKALCESADALKTDLPNTNLVFGVGNPTADLMIVGEAPGETEDRLMEPFVGKAGQLLDQIMAAIKFDRNQIYIANILKHRPPQNRDPKPEERQRSLPYLLRQIELVDPKIILCVGKVSATTLLDKDLSLKQMRQKFHDFHGRELMVTYHPAALLRNPQWKRPTWEDVQQLRARYDELGGS